MPPPFPYLKSTLSVVTPFKPLFDIVIFVIRTPTWSTWSYILLVICMVCWLVSNLHGWLWGWTCTLAMALDCLVKKFIPMNGGKSTQTFLDCLHQCCASHAVLCGLSLVPPPPSYYSHIGLATMLKLVFLHSRENTSHLKRDKHPSHWHPSFTTIHPRCCNRWSEFHCPHAGCCLTCFSELSQLTVPNVFAATWRFVHAPCYCSSIMLKCFWLAIIPTLCSAQ